ncbi:MAG TPA: alpha/beta hydrolase [Paracoccus sp.]|nr:alpha/beta hydrolase [Paracoccus sp. (in: a-proteobacteria)]
MNVGRHIHIHRAGTGPALVFLHGWTMAGDIFTDAFARLTADFTCLAPDLPGHGGTRGFAASVEGAVAMLDHMLEHEGLADVTLIGWSLGALIGWRYLEQHGAERVRAMVSLDMSPCPLNGPDWALGMRGQSTEDGRAKSSRFREDWPRSARAIARTMFAGPHGAPALGTDQAEARIKAQPAAVMAGFWDSLIECDLRATVGRLPVPLLAIHGAQSRVYPPELAEWLARHSPACRALILPGAGHAPLLEAPSETCDAIARFARNPMNMP